MHCFCHLPCSTTSDDLLVCHHYTSNTCTTRCLFILHNINVSHFENSINPIACHCARCLATLSIAKRILYDNTVTIPFDHVHCHACGNFCMLKQSNKNNANQTRFYIVCASNCLKSDLQLTSMKRPTNCEKFFAWADYLRTPPDQSIAQRINRIVAIKRKDNNEYHDSV